MFRTGRRPTDLASRTTTVTISKEETNYTINIVKSLQKCSKLKKGVSEKIQNKSKEQKVDFLVFY